MPASLAAPELLRERLGNAVVLITGAGRGIGRAAALAFASCGARLFICSRTAGELERTAHLIREAGGRVASIRADIAVSRDASMIIARCIRQYGKLDILVNNAGILGPRVPLTQYPLRAWADTLRINLTGTFLISRAAARFMLNQHNGLIITMSSSVGRKARANWGAYAVSKFGVEGLTQLLADELGSSGIRAVTFNPGGTRTRMRAAAYPREDPLTVQQPEVVADALVRLAAWLPSNLSGRALSPSDVPQHITG